MMDLTLLEEQLSQLPLYMYSYIDPKGLEFSDRIRYICQAECPMYGKTWACPPGVGPVDTCKATCLSYNRCLLIGTITEVEDIADIEAGLATRGDHEEVTNQVRDLFRQQGIEPYILHRSLRHLRPLRLLGWPALPLPGKDAPLRGEPRH